MKKIVELLLTILLCCTISVCASAETWKCNKCDSTNTTFYCGNCGSAKELWECAGCEQENGTDKCTKCGMTKEESDVKSCFSYSSSISVYHYSSKHFQSAINVYDKLTDNKIHMDDYSDDCKLHPYFILTNNSASAQNITVSFVCNGNNFSFDPFVIDPHNSERFVIKDVELKTSDSPYRIEWIINGVRVTNDEFLVSDGNSKLYEYLQEAYGFSASLKSYHRLKDTDTDNYGNKGIEANNNIQRGIANQLADNEDFYLCFDIYRSGGISAQFGPPDLSFELEVYGFLNCEINAVLNDNIVVFWDECDANSLYAHSREFKEHFKYAEGANEVIYYINGMEFLRKTFEILQN